MSSYINNNYLDLDDLIEDLDTGKTVKACSEENISYNTLLETISQIGKMADKTDKLFPVKNGQDLTADLFANMSDSEMLSHFLPVKGIDFDQGENDTGFPEKEKDKDQKKGKDQNKPLYYADEFMPHRMMPQLNPLYQLSAFKSAISNNAEQKQQQQHYDEDLDNNDGSDVYIVSEVDFDAESDKADELNQLSEGRRPSSGAENTNTTPREIKKRKPRTYKYNPKPLQQKVCRSFVPDDLKDIEYWARRKRNNEAAKKSREERRKKELEILKSYEMMKQEYSQIKIENIRLKARNSMLEKQIAELKWKVK
jgi:hypothetical protein